LMDELMPAGGAMMQVDAGEDAILPYLAAHAGAVEIGAVNGPGKVVLSGREPAVAALAAALRTDGLATRLLKVSHAFHSPDAEPVLAALAAAEARLNAAPAAIPLISNLTGAPLPGGLPGPGYWAQHARRAVRFADGVAALSGLADTFIEIGPDGTLCALGAGSVGREGRWWLPSAGPRFGDALQLARTLGQLFVRGARLDPVAIHGTVTPPAGLPTYPFQRRRWPYPERPADPLHSGSLLGRREAAATGAVFLTPVAGTHQPFLRDHRIANRVVVPASFHLCLALAAARKTGPGDAVAVRDALFPAALVLDADAAAMLRVRLTAAGDFAVTLADDDTALKATATIAPAEEMAEGDGFAEMERLRGGVAGEPAATALYSPLDAIGIGLGAGYRWAEDVWRGTGEAVIRLRPPTAAEAAWSRPLHPALLDTLFQAIGVAWPAGRYPAGRVCVPAAVGCLRVLAGAGTPLWCHVRLDPSDDRLADLRAWDGDGRLAVAVDGLRIAWIDPAQFTAGAAGWQDWVHELDWVAVPAPTPDPARIAAEWIILGDAGPAEILARQLGTLGAGRVTVADTTVLPAGAARIVHLVPA
ncbi:polyketide synthase dehydratase domain-containing protein, partial [Azospirillum sp. B506]|uniref:polyketide synthase dehydratase domain-containing protein n=1 Tax=Azospirillum sp. B506 TaxID=137721 RepID=UPI0005B2796F